MTKQKVLVTAAKRMGLPGHTRVHVVALAVAVKMNRARPVTKRSCYALLREFIGVEAKERRVPKVSRHQAKLASDAFLLSYEWRKLRMVILKKFGARCQCCGATPADGLRMHVDHIKPRRLHPELALVESNLQVLCEECNHGKGNWDETDWRAEQGASEYERLAPLWWPAKPAN